MDFFFSFALDNYAVRSNFLQIILYNVKMNKSHVNILTRDETDLKLFTSDLL